MLSNYLTISQLVTALPIAPFSRQKDKGDEDHLHQICSDIQGSETGD
jgi:hypothetical protein